MATKTKKKPAAKKAEPKVKAWGMFPPYHVLREADLEQGLRDVYHDQVRVIKELEKKLEFEKSKLPKLQSQITEHLKKIKTLKFKPEPIREYDEPVKKQIARLEYSKTTWPKNKKVVTPTGAVKWDSLRSAGATDAQIRKNLLSLEQYWGGEFYVDKQRDQLVIRQNGTSKAICSGQKVVDEVRRIMSIPFPTAGKVLAKPPVKKKKSAPKKSSKPKAKKPSAKTASPASAGRKKATPKKVVQKTPATTDVREPASLDDVEVLIERWPHEYAMLKKRLRKKPSPAQVLKHMSHLPIPAKTPGADAEGSPEPSAVSQIVAHATGQLPDASKSGQLSKATKKKAASASKKKEPWVVADNEPEVPEEFNAIGEDFDSADANPDLVLPKKSRPSRRSA